MSVGWHRCGLEVGWPPPAAKQAAAFGDYKRTRIDGRRRTAWGRECDFIAMHFYRLSVLYV
jgi:hypothetical protein